MPASIFYEKSSEQFAKVFVSSSHAFLEEEKPKVKLEFCYILSV